MIIQQEPWLDVAPEFDRLGVLNFVEADISEGKVAYDLDHEAMEDLARGNMLHITTARVNGELVGYALSFVLPRHFQYKAKMAQYIGVYLLPEHRKGMAGLKLLRADEAALKAKGVDVIYGGYAKGKDLGVLFDRLGFQVAQLTYTKWI